MNWRAIGSSISQGIQTAVSAVARFAARVVAAVDEATSPAAVEQSARALGQAGQSYLRDLGRQPFRVPSIYFLPIATINIFNRLPRQDQQRLAIQTAVFGFPFAMPLVTGSQAVSTLLWGLRCYYSDPFLISPAGTPSSVQQFAANR